MDTPDGEVRGSTVSKITIQHTDGALVVPAAKGFDGRVMLGEATVVDLGDGRYLFVLLGNDSAQLREAHREAYDAATKGGGNWIPRWMNALERQTTPRPVPPEYYPLLVTFGDINDPASVRRVDPADLAATFGAGFGLREITLEVTDDAVTEGVVEGVFDYFTWPKEKRKEYRCSVGDCLRFPLKIPNPDGTTTILTGGDFTARKLQ